MRRTSDPSKRFEVAAIAKHRSSTRQGEVKVLVVLRPERSSHQRFSLPEQRARFAAAICRDRRGLPKTQTARAQGRTGRKAFMSVPGICHGPVSRPRCRSTLIIRAADPVACAGRAAPRAGRQSIAVDIHCRAFSPSTRASCRQRFAPGSRLGGTRQRYLLAPASAGCVPYTAPDRPPNATAQRPGQAGCVS